MKFFIYSRKSIYTGKGESIENQIEMCRSYISAKFPSECPHAISIYEDEGFSAKNTQRPQFQKLLRDLSTNTPDFIVCYRLDRISRSVSDFSTLIEELNVRSISFVCIKEEFDTSKPMGKAMMYIASVFAQLERETIAERVRDNMLLLARSGRWLGGTTPTGYTSEKRQEIVLDGRVKTTCQLRDNPHELYLVDAIFREFLSLRSLSSVARNLTLHSLHPRGGGNFSLLGIRNILQNPVYCIADENAWDYFTHRQSDVCFPRSGGSRHHGLLSYNKRDYSKKGAPRQPMEKWIIAVGCHDGRISGRDWVLVQSILADNAPLSPQPTQAHNDYALLSGLLRCAQCGSPMFAKTRSHQSAFDYLCQRKLLGGSVRCPCQNLGGKQTDALVWNALMAHTSPSANLWHDLIATDASDTLLQSTSEPDIVAQNIQKCTQEMNHLVATLSQATLTPPLVSRINQRMEELDATHHALLTQQETLRQADVQTPPEELSALLYALTQHPHDGLTVADRRRLVRLLVDEMSWDGTDLVIRFHGVKNLP